MRGTVCEAVRSFSVLLGSLGTRTDGIEPVRGPRDAAATSESVRDAGSNWASKGLAHADVDAVASSLAPRVVQPEIDVVLLREQEPETHPAAGKQLVRADVGEGGRDRADPGEADEPEL